MANNDSKAGRLNPATLVSLPDGRRGQVLGTDPNGNTIVGINPRNFGTDTLHDTIVACPQNSLKMVGQWRRPELVKHQGKKEKAKVNSPNFR